MAFNMQYILYVTSEYTARDCSVTMDTMSTSCIVTVDSKLPTLLP